ncbi:MAG: SgcJ/EcaC family oxidoreductase [Sphingomicrobium sp.]
MQMKFLALSIIAAAMPAAAPAAPAVSPAANCAPVTDAVVEAQFDRFNAAWATKDPDTVSALFAPDAVLLPTLSDEERTTPEGIHRYFVYFLKSAPVGRIDTSSIRLGCNMAARMGNWSVDLTDPNTGAKSTAKARYTFVYRYDGKDWRIEHLHSSLLPDMP